MNWHGHGQQLHRSNRSYTADSLQLRGPSRVRVDRQALSMSEERYTDEQRMATKALIRRTHSHCRVSRFCSTAMTVCLQVHLRRMSTASTHTPNPSFMCNSSLLGGRRKESSMRGGSPLVHTWSLSPPTTPLDQPTAMGSKRLTHRMSKNSQVRLEWADVVHHADEYC